MRKRRIKVLGQRAVYHCITRVVGGQFLLDEGRSKEVLRKQMGQVATFCGVEILTYCIMSNHVHLLVRVPSPEELVILDDEALLERCRALYTQKQTTLLILENRLKSSDAAVREEARGQLIARMGDVSAFMKELKQRFSIWYNRTHNRYGTLWAERFKSVLVENSRSALMMVAAYIDLNPVRAGLVSDPKQYRYCGYAEMIAKEGLKISGLVRAFSRSGYSIDEALHEYRKLLYGVGAYGKTSEGPRMKSAAVERVLREGEKFSRNELLRHRVRYFSDGVVIGSRSFVQERFQSGVIPTSKRKSKQMPLIPFEGNQELAAFRNLRKQPVSKSAQD